MMSFGIPFVGWLACMLPVQGTGAQFVPGAQGEATSYELFEGTAAVPSYTGAVELGLNASLIGCLAGQPSPWSGRYAPDGNHVYVTLFGGGLGGSNCLVAKLDAQTLAPVSTIQVGLAPEEIAFTTTTQGALEYGFVTNSTGSSVSVFNAADQVVATIPIPVQPGDPFGTAFPFGLAVAPDQSRVYVGTLDGSGNIYAINVATLALEPTETIAFGADHGFARLTFAGEILVVPITVYNPGFQGSTGEVAFLDPKSPGTLSEVVLATSPTASAFPNPIDVEVLGPGVRLRLRHGAVRVRALRPDRPARRAHSDGDGESSGQAARAGLRRSRPAGRGGPHYRRGGLPGCDRASTYRPVRHEQRVRLPQPAERRGDRAGRGQAVPPRTRVEHAGRVRASVVREPGVAVTRLGFCRPGRERFLGVLP